MKPIKDGVVTRDYGVRSTTYAAGYHTGRDYRALVGTRVRATHRGRVVFVGRGGWGDSYGIHVVVKSRWGTVRHGYCHLSKVSVRVGQRVRAGDKLGESGATGQVTAQHLHYEERVSPFSYWNSRRPRFDS